MNAQQVPASEIILLREVHSFPENASIRVTGELVGGTYQFIGELARCDEELVLRARTVRRVDGLSLAFYEKCLLRTRPAFRGKVPIST
eukprot:GEMP01136117.1.p1 GENE.GEMP01136117.1~~GEMP01136117.1.p1  ORF type:complete len:101 (+),score=15.08 GEMP01136117.1:41-304(+)